MRGECRLQLVSAHMQVTPWGQGASRKYLGFFVQKLYVLSGLMDDWCTVMYSKEAEKLGRGSWMQMSWWQPVHSIFDPRSFTCQTLGISCFLIEFAMISFYCYPER